MQTSETRPIRAVNPENILISPEDARRDWLGGISESTEGRLRATLPGFPQRVEISPGRSYFLKHELDQYIADRIAARDRGEIPAAMRRGRELGQRARGRPRKPDPRQLELLAEPAE